MGNAGDGDRFKLSKNGRNYALQRVNGRKPSRPRGDRMPPLEPAGMGRLNDSAWQAANPP
jgi:hypothetical protein